MDALSVVLALLLALGTPASYGSLEDGKGAGYNLTLASGQLWQCENGDPGQPGARCWQVDEVCSWIDGQMVCAKLPPIAQGDVFVFFERLCDPGGHKWADVAPGPVNLWVDATGYGAWSSEELLGPGRTNGSVQELYEAAIRALVTGTPPYHIALCE